VATPCYKIEMTKTIEQWLLFTFEHGEFTPLSKPFKTKKLAEKARLKYPDRVRRNRRGSRANPVVKRGNAGSEAAPGGFNAKMLCCRFVAAKITDRIMSVTLPSKI
jgi:hypothetical protein